MLPVSHHNVLTPQGVSEPRRELVKTDGRTPFLPALTP